MPNGIPFRSRHQLEWQLVLVDPRLLEAAQAQLSASGPSHAIEQALRLALHENPNSDEPRPGTPVH
ncbi:MAG TPA: hypothetical protein VE861_07705 [Gemmatimonadaceae bacterium]|nr:hypothetical protein [Gemmatimonadaceae bacterium]